MNTLQRLASAAILGAATAAGGCSEFGDPSYLPKTPTCLGAPDTAYARHACRVLADGGNADAMAFLGDDAAVGGDLPLAYGWYRKAADSGNTRVLRRLFDAYNRGGDIPQSKTLAASYLAKAQAAGQEWALLFAARALESRDPAGAAAAYDALARKGNCFAQGRLALAYGAGDLGPRSPAYATYWGLLALSGGPERAADYDPDAGLFTQDAARPLYPVACADLKTVVDLSRAERGLPLPVLRAAQDAAALWKPGAADPDLPGGAFGPDDGAPIAPSPAPAVQDTEAAAAPDPAYPPPRPPALAPLPAPHSLALVIGIDGYESGPRALYAEQDARDFGIFADKALGIAPDRIKLLMGRAARRLDIERALSLWMPPRLTRGESRVIVYFAGHGLADPHGGEPYLLPYDGEADLLEASAIRAADLIRHLKALGAAHVTLILDTCTGGRTRDGQSLLPDLRPIELTPKDIDLPGGTAILSAAGPGQMSHALPQAGHGLFTYEVLKGLEGPADLNGDRTITLGELLDYVQGPVSREASRLGSAQTPRLTGDSDDVLARW